MSELMKKLFNYSGVCNGNSTEESLRKGDKYLFLNSWRESMAEKFSSLVSGFQKIKDSLLNSFCATTLPESLPVTSVQNMWGKVFFINPLQKHFIARLRHLVLSHDFRVSLSNSVLQVDRWVDNRHFQFHLWHKFLRFATRSVTNCLAYRSIL